MQIYGLIATSCKPISFDGLFNSLMTHKANIEPTSTIIQCLSSKYIFVYLLKPFAYNILSCHINILTDWFLQAKIQQIIETAKLSKKKVFAQEGKCESDGQKCEGDVTPIDSPSHAETPCTSAFRAKCYHVRENLKFEV